MRPYYGIPPPSQVPGFCETGGCHNHYRLDTGYWEEKFQRHLSVKRSKILSSMSFFYNGMVCRISTQEMKV